MAIFNRNNGGIMDVIRCDEPSYLIWKWHPAGSIPGKSKRENAIRWGTSLRVREGSVAVFVYSQPDGTIQEYIEGPCDVRLDTENLPILASLRGLLYGGDTPFQAEIYFINLAGLIQIPFGVPYFDLFDPRFIDFGVPTAVRGSINFQITDYREFIKLHRLENFDMEAFKRQIRGAVAKVVKSIVANAPEEYGIPVMQIERKISEINRLAEDPLKERLQKDFGVTVSGIDIDVIEIDKASEGWQQLKAVTQDISTATIQAQTEVNIKKMQDTQRIEAEHLEGTLRAQREEAQYAQRMQTQSSHLTTHQINQQTAAAVAGAEALGQMGAGGAMGVGGGGINPAAMMTGMMMGGAIGQNMAGMMNGMMGGLAQPAVGATPPPIPIVAYHVAVNGQSSGPFDLATLSQMIMTGTFLRDSLVWKPGMANWAKAGEIQELQELFEKSKEIPPEIPS